MSNAAGGSLNGVSQDYDDGRRAGLAFGALALAIVAFVNLLSLEKSILAAVLAIIALRGAGGGPAAGRGRLALGIAAIHMALWVTIITLFHQKLVELGHLLQRLG